jgi:hypothetical protein
MGSTKSMGKKLLKIEIKQGDFAAGQNGISLQTSKSPNQITIWQSTLKIL